MTPGKEELEGRCTRRRMRCGELRPVRKMVKREGEAQGNTY
jgi:hypothetical protein